MKWKDKRHRELPLLQKVAYDYLWDNCEYGFYKIADIDSSAWEIGCSPDELRTAIHELAKPKKKPATTELQRGFVLVGGIVWISHFLKHNLGTEFGKKAINPHKAAVTYMMDHYEDFKNEPEFIDVLDSIKEEVFDQFRIVSHRKMERLNNNIIPLRKTEKPKPVSNDPIQEVYKVFRRCLKKEILDSPKRDQRIRDFLRDTNHTVEEIEKVAKNRYDAWNNDKDMNGHLTIETILDIDKFTKYLESAQNEKKSKGQGLVIGQERSVHNG